MTQQSTTATAAQPPAIITVIKAFVPSAAALDTKAMLLGVSLAD